jgi:hypothetical protein
MAGIARHMVARVRWSPAGQSAEEGPFMHHVRLDRTCSVREAAENIREKFGVDQNSHALFLPFPEEEDSPALEEGQVAAAENEASGESRPTRVFGRWLGDASKPLGDACGETEEVGVALQLDLRAVDAELEFVFPDGTRGHLIVSLQKPVSDVVVLIAKRVPATGVTGDARLLAANPDADEGDWMVLDEALSIAEQVDVPLSGVWPRGQKPAFRMEPRLLTKSAAKTG